MNSKIIPYMAIGVALISLLIGVVSRLLVVPVALTTTGGVEAHAFLEFGSFCLLFAIAVSLLQMSKSKQ